TSLVSARAISAFKSGEIGSMINVSSWGGSRGCFVFANEMHDQGDDRKHDGSWCHPAFPYVLVRLRPLFLFSVLFLLSRLAKQLILPRDIFLDLLLFDLRERSIRRAAAKIWRHLNRILVRGVDAPIVILLPLPPGVRRVLDVHHPLDVITRERLR